MELYIIRHGQTESNVKEITQGTADSPLTELGKEQAIKVASKLKGIQFNKILASDLGRTIKTAEIVKETLQLTIPIVPAPELREMDFGNLNNSPRTKIKEICPDFSTNTAFTFHNGESLDLMYKRIHDFVNKLKETEHKEPLLLITHMGPIRAIISYAHGISYIKTKEYNVTNECIFRLTLNNKKEPQLEQLA